MVLSGKLFTVKRKEKTMQDLSIPGTSSRWVDIPKKHPRKRNGYPIEIIEALNKARDNGVKCSDVVEALSKVTQTKGV